MGKYEKQMMIKRRQIFKWVNMKNSKLCRISDDGNIVEKIA